MTLICGLYGDKLESIDIRNIPKNPPPDVKAPQSERRSRILQHVSLFVYYRPMFEDIMKKGIQLVQKLNKEYPSIIYWAITPSKLFESVERQGGYKETISSRAKEFKKWVGGERGGRDCCNIWKYFSARVTVPKSEPKCQRKISAD